MDIFTTQIAQAAAPISAPIKPDKLKVKALVKEARLEKLKKDLRELDGSAYALYQPEKHSDEDDAQFAEQDDEIVELSDKAKALEKQDHSDAVVEKNSVEKNNLPSKANHLDIFI